MTEYRIDDLARAAGTTSRNVRAYQERGLLPPPEKRGRVGIYGDAHLERLEQVTGIHLARFGAKEGLVVSWIRQDGSPGTTQGPLTPEDLERMRAEREARQASS